STAASNTTVANGTAIKIVGSGFVTPEALVISGTGIANRGAIFNIGGKNTLSSAITLNADATIFSTGTNSNTDSLVITGSISSGSTGAIITNGLILSLDAGNSASYPGTGTTWYDLSGNGNNFTMQGNISWDASLGFGNFQGNSTGTGNRFTSNNTSFAKNLKTANGGNGYTTIAWARVTSASASWQKIMGHSDGDSYIDIYANPTTPTYHQEDGSTIWVNGNIVSNDSYNLNGAGFLMLSSTNLNGLSNTVPLATFSIGNEPGGNSYPWYGNIYSVMVYNRVLSSSEINQIYNSLTSKSGSTSGSSANLTINTDKGIRISGVISGGGQLTKLGSDSLLLTGTYSSTGAVNINAGSVKLGATNIINDSTDIYFNGGNLTTGYNETIRRMYLTDNSTLTLGQTPHALTFIYTDSLLNNKTLLINGWAGSSYTAGNASGTGGKIYTTDSLLSYQLDRMRFVNAADNLKYYTVQLNSQTVGSFNNAKELVPKDNTTDLPTGYSNVTISSDATSGGTWSGTGTVANPYVFTPSTDDAVVSYAEIQSKLALSDGNVQITTSRSGGTKAGSIIVNSIISGTNSSSVNTRTLSLLARNNVVVYKDIVLTGSGYATSSPYPVPNLVMQADVNDIVVQAGLKLNGTNQSQADTVANGGDVTLTAVGRVRIAANGYIQANGAANTSTNSAAVGGNGGTVTLNGLGGISILSYINSINGKRGSGTTDSTLSRPGTLILNTNNASPGVFDGQSGATLAVGNIIKKGTGKIVLTSTRWAGHTGSADIYYKAADTVYDGTLKLGTARTLSDSANIYVNAGTYSGTGVLDLGGFSETIGTIAGAGTITSTTGTLTLSGVTTKSSNPIFTSFSGGLSGPFGIIKNGVDSLQLSGDNATSNVYTGVFTITDGVVKVSNQNALGTTAGNTIINGTGTILIDSNNYTIAEPFNITGNGAAATTPGAIRNLGKITTLTGAITLGGSATISSFGYNTPANGVGFLDSLILKTGGINAGSYTLTTDVIKGMRIDGVISGTGGNLNKISNDTLILGGTNTYTGLTTINAGVVEIKNSAAFGSASGTTSLISGSTIQIEGSDYTIPEPITIRGSGVVVNSQNQGAIKNIRNKNTWTGPITLGANATIVSGTLSGTTTDQNKWRYFNNKWRKYIYWGNQY
ncbi:hypothetical protein EB001_14965, partial [bacterium]|nr:hypothetical protein [bacterium]